VAAHNHLHFGIRYASEIARDNCVRIRESGLRMWIIRRPHVVFLAFFDARRQFAQVRRQIIGPYRFRISGTKYELAKTGLPRYIYALHAEYSLIGILWAPIVCCIVALLAE